MTDHEQFIDKLKKQYPHTVDYSRMSDTNIICELLKAKGVSDKLINHPTFKSQMTKMFSDILNNNQPGSREDKVKVLQSVINSGSYKDYHFDVTANGEFEYDVNAKQAWGDTFPDKIHRFYSVDDNKQLHMIDIETREWSNQQSGPAIFYESKKKIDRLYDKDGLQIQENSAQYSQEKGNPYTITGSSYQLTRNADLVTGNYEVSDIVACNMIEFSEQQAHTPLSLNFTRVPDEHKSSACIAVVDNRTPDSFNFVTTYPTNAIRTFKEVKSKIQEHESDQFKDLAPDKLAFYQKLASDYPYMYPGAVTPEEETYRKDRIKGLQEYAFKDKFLRDIAEKRGISQETDRTE